MPLVDTLRFGALEYDLSGVIQFPAGVPGFEEQRRFVLIEQADLTPFVFLQSIETPVLCFPALPLGAIERHYDLAIGRDDLELLNLAPARQPAMGSEVLCLAVVAAPNGQPSANLLAPIVINLAQRIGVQAVRGDARYSHCHPLTPEAACS